MIMKGMFAWCWLVIILVKKADTTPIPDKVNMDPEEEANPELPDGDVLLGGDMLLNPDEAQQAKADELPNQASVESQRGIQNNVKKWPDNTLYYDLSQVSGWFDHPKSIRRALDDLQARLDNCIKFKESTTAKNRVKVSGNQAGCFAYMGLQPSQPQQLNLKFSTLGPSCRKIGIIQHEFLHALGFFHTQMRSDRDEYVTINDKNIKKGKENNFIKYDENLVDHFNITFDYDSLMMYEKNAFSNSLFGTSITVKTKDPKMQAKIGQRDGVSAGDIKMVKAAYGCKEK